MFRFLFKLYEHSPFWLRNILAKIVMPLRFFILFKKYFVIPNYLICLDATDNGSFPYIAHKKDFEHLELNTFLSLIAYNRGAHIIDVGAHYGAYTLAAASFSQYSLVKSITSIEPDPRPYQALKRALKANHFPLEVNLQKIVASDTVSNEKLFINARSSSDNRTHSVISAPIKAKRVISVPSDTIDNIFLATNTIEQDKFIVKMDVQGNELRVLSGMSKILKSACGYAVFFEYAPFLIESAGLKVKAFIDLMKNISFDRAYQFGTDIQQLSSREILFEKLQTATEYDEKRLQGYCTNFLIVNNMDDSFLQELLSVNQAQ